MKMRITYLLMISMLLVAAGCKKESIQEEVYTDVSAFRDIQLNSSFDLYLTEGSTYSIRVEADETVADYITYEVIDSLLIIDNEKSFKWLRPTKNKIKIFITSPPLHQVMAQETCFIRTVNPITSSEFHLVFKSKANNADLELNCGAFLYWNNYPCGGTLTLSGTSNSISLANFALVNIQAQNLNTLNADVFNSSKGECVVNVSNHLRYSIKGDGNIEVYGSPTSIEEVVPATGTGELIMN
jgi:hypothetical protein